MDGQVQIPSCSAKYHGQRRFSFSLSNALVQPPRALALLVTSRAAREGGSAGLAGAALLGVVLRHHVLKIGQGAACLGGGVETHLGSQPAGGKEAARGWALKQGACSMLAAPH